MGLDVDLDPHWLTGDGLPPRHGHELIRLLAALSRAASLQEAARAVGVSYRHAWGLLGSGARAFGAPLVDMQRGRGARLTASGQRLLEADLHVRTSLGGQLERLRHEVRAMLGEALPRRRRRILVRASHDLALPLLARRGRRVR